jgi:hypothetical protein
MGLRDLGGRRAIEGTAKAHFRRKTEIQHLHRPIEIGLDVGWLQIAVHDPPFVRSFECVGD